MQLKCLLLLTALQMCVSGVFSQISEDSCSTYYFAKAFGHSGYIYTPKLTLLPGGDIIASCYKGNYFNVAKLSAKGDTIWNKLYDIPNSFPGGHQKGVVDIDGNLLFAVNGNCFIKIDTSGKFLSGKQIGTLASVVIYDMAMLADGDKIILYSDNTGDGAILARLDKDLNTVKWCKTLSFYWTFFSNILIDQNNIIIGGDCAETIYSFDTHSFIGKVDAANGNLLQFRYYKAQNSYSYMSDIYKCGKGYLASCYLVNEDPGSGRHAYIRFDDQLNFLNARRIAGHTNTTGGDWNFRYLPQPDGSFYVADGETWDLTLSYIDNKDSIKWVKDMPSLFSYPSDITQYKNNALYITGNENDFFVGPNTYGATSYVVKCDLNGNVGNCPTQQYPTFHTDSYDFSEGINTLYVNDATLTITTTSASVSNYYPVVGDNCISVSICDSLHLKANNFTCTQDPVYVTGVRNIGCSSPIIWNVTPASGFDIQNSNDSTASLAFNKSGLYKVTGYISRQCGDTIKDSILIHVNLSANIDLGRDTFLCTGNILVLHAGNQFSSYKWQDGSTDSVYAVTVPGKYYIDVTDFCNNTYGDTINVAALPDYHFHINNASKCNNDSILLVAPDGFAHYAWTPDYDITINTGRTVKVFPEIDTSYVVAAEISEGCYIYDTVQIAVNHSPKIFLGNDTTLCDGQQLILNAGNGFISYAWNTGETTSHIIAGKAGAFGVTATANNGCMSSDTLVIKSVYALPVFSLGNDTVLCQKQYLNYDFNLPGLTYLWDNGSSSSERRLETAGSYWLRVTQQGCSSTDSINLSYKPLPVINLGNDTTLCEGTVKMLNAENINALYQWQDLSTESSYTVSSPGTYYVSVMVNNCTNSDTVKIQYMPKPSFSLGATSFLCLGEQITLSPEVHAAQTFLWQDGSNSASLVVRQQGIYTLTVTNECGSYTNSITISEGNCTLEMPNAFTPNNDGLNDVFRVKYPGFIKSFHMMIFNRFGDKVFETYDPAKGWDGKLNSVDQPIGPYVWIINLIGNNNTPQNSKGTIILLR